MKAQTVWTVFIKYEFLGEFFSNNCLGLQDCFVDSGTITARSVKQEFEGRHYFDMPP